jgi:hypothetical protein
VDLDESADALQVTPQRAVAVAVNPV